MNHQQLSIQHPHRDRAVRGTLLTVTVTAVLLALPVAASAQGEIQAPEGKKPMQVGNDNRAPEVPATLQVPDGNKVSFHTYAVGVQIYGATASATSPTGFAWTFQAPEAVLFDADGNVVGIHYAFAGPTRPAWESESGSRVVGARTVPPVTVTSNAIPWLILSAVPTNTVGPGIFARTTYIQRVNTTGGLAPATAPTALGQEAHVPYTAEYFFFRATK